MSWWQLAAAADAVIALVYLGISAAIAVPLVEARQLRRNRLALATALIFATCAVGHGDHAAHLLLHAPGGAAVAAVRSVVDWHQAVVDAATAVVGLWYWSLRRSYGRLLQSATLFEDLHARAREAAEINDTVVQGIVTAQVARRLGRHEEADVALEATLGAARQLVSRLMAEASTGRRQDAGDFVRRTAAQVVPGPRADDDVVPERR